MLLRCREMDVGLVKSVLEEAKREYGEKDKTRRPPNITLDSVYLPPPPTSANVHGPSW